MGGVNDYIILAVTMLANFVLGFLLCKFVVYRGREDTLVFGAKPLVKKLWRKRVKNKK